jgi:Cu2+-containing amine oxidase
LYAAGRYTMQSQVEQGGVHDMVARKDKVENEDLVVWNVFGLTHNPRYVIIFPSTSLLHCSFFVERIERMGRVQC